MDRFQVIVGNIGTVYYGPSQHSALLAFEHYRALSMHRSGRASGESVTCLHRNNVLWEYVGDLDSVED